ncbi:hypothetical protein ACEPAH_2244 [Sanghuangporus vaninii]
MTAFVYLALLFVANTVRAQACPTLPSPLPAPTDLPVIDVMPDPFTFFNNASVQTPEDWDCRRAELLLLVQEYMYGYYPDHSQETVNTTRAGNSLSITISANGKSATFGASLALPTNVRATPQSPVPVVISAGGVDNNVFLGSGVALATFNLPDVAADSTTRTGTFWTLYSDRDIGVLTAWGWGYHRVLDAIIQVAPELDATRVGSIGCSRYGKAALAAGIFDERITLSMPMSSGTEGIAPWRFHFEELASVGENEKITNITGVYPYWTNTNLLKFVNDAQQIPFDSHINAALVAPRAIIWDEGETDYWTNPEGEAEVTFPATKAVFDFLGVGDKVGVAIRDSWHCDFSGYSNIQAFMLKEFFGTPTTRNYSDISPYTPFPEAYPWINDMP